MKIDAFLKFALGLPIEVNSAVVLAKRRPGNATRPSRLDDLNDLAKRRAGSTAVVNIPVTLIGRRQDLSETETALKLHYPSDSGPLQEAQAEGLCHPFAAVVQRSVGMPLGAGARLGPYEIVSAIGAGGMGEVYRAHDSRLNRTVAIKVLTGERSLDPADRERFLREARAVSNLNHAHICTLHDIGSANGIDYLVMEYIEGPTLRQRLSKGAFAYSVSG